ncbi:conserved hypothetical protein [Desulforapulum autotrophicum HRM2]|uniref:DUF748 domain-containing protein n=1 Tax=Desulforapulum autotrophicum (strain ATCC 43914 / DSM 3382 / VKM B-1955 / HRM2) TaxID=177437 RepID=C0QIA0_DESAH|nr:DUF748 domain-containing protein [Desulforapulum autotrophicum]ACN15836.1 conserved hypothetical protein [Desulforapulum autotrophicum HRM2]
MAIKEIFLKKRILIPVIIMVLYTLVGFFLVPVLGKNILCKSLGKALNRQVTIERIAVNPYALTATIEEFSVAEQNKDALFFAKRIFANLSLSSLFTLGLNVSEFSLENPRVSIVRNRDATFNFSDLLALGQDNKTDAPEKDEENKGPIRFTLKNIHITQGEFKFEDQFTNVSHAVTDFSLMLPLLTSREKSRHEAAGMDINFVVNQATVDVHVESTPFAADMATQVEIKISDVDVVHYLSYLPIPETIQLKSLGMNLDLDAAYRSTTPKPSLQIQGKVTAVNAEIKGAAEEEIIKFPSLTVDISPSDILAGKLNITKILMQTPQLNLSRDKTGTVNLLTYIPQKQAPPQQAENKVADNKADKTHSDPFSLNLDNFEIKDATVGFQDLSNEQAFNTTLFPINVLIKNVKAGSTISGEYRLTLASEIKEDFETSGRFQTHPVQAQGSMNLSNLVLNKYLPYYAGLINFDVNDGRATLSANFDISEKPDKLETTINTVDFMVQSLVISDHDAKEQMVEIPEFNIKGASIDLSGKQINTGVITLRDANFFIQRDKAGELNLVKGLLPDKETKKPNTPVLAPQDKPSKVDTPPWALTMTSFDAKQMNLRFNDLTPSNPVTIDLSKISIKADNVKNFGDEQAMVSVEMNWQKEGRINISGSVTPSTLKADLGIDLKKIDVKSLQSYFTDTVAINVLDGNVGTKGRLNLNMGDSPGSSIQFTGETSLNKFISTDKPSAKDLFKCKSLYLSGLDLSLFPVKINIKNISLTDFYSRIFVNETGEMNLAALLNTNTPQDQVEESEKKPEKTETEPPQIKVESITLQGGHISFSDYFNQPNFNAGMKQIAGSVNGLSSEELSRAKLVLKGIYGQSSPLDIVGTINPLAQNKYADVAVSFKDIELANFTPYSSKYLGYTIQKGKLILDLEYKINGNTLKSENRVRLDNLSLGDQVTGQKPTSLPLGLAISLLKNREGKINLDVPVAGALDDPKFRIGPIVLNTLKNLIIKVVTSPFSIIGSMFGGGEELGYVDFDHGESALTQGNHDKLNKLAEILKEKPSIRFEIKGVYDTLRDAEVLRVKQFEDAIKAVKLKNLTDSGTAPRTVDQVAIDQQDMDSYISTTYEQAQFPKPRDEAGNEKELDLNEKKKLLMTNIDVKKDDLRLLAMTRSEKIKGYLISTGKVEKERIFLLEPVETDSSTTDQSCRVTFSLK